jgi:hypothetical protein
VIIEIPSSEDFRRSSLALLNLAWTSASASLAAYRESEVIHPVEYEDDDPSAAYATSYTPEERREAERRYWMQSQHSLGNALSLVQQSVEMALRGRIAAVSPYLLIVRDPRDLPKGSTQRDVPFSAFRSIDASDLVKVHNSFCSPDTRLDAAFEQFWEALRRERNIFIHSVRPANAAQELLRAEFLVEQILLAARWLHPEKSWFQHRLDHSTDDEDAIAHQIPEDATYTFIMQDFVRIIDDLSPKAQRDYFSLDKKRRRYACLACLNRCDRNYLDGNEWESTLCAQLYPNKGRSSDAKAVKCALCGTITPVVRQACNTGECRGNVVARHYDPYHPGQLVCLSCDNPQDENDSRRLAHWLPGAPERDDLLERPGVVRRVPVKRQPEDAEG